MINEQNIDKKTFVVGTYAVSPYRYYTAVIHALTRKLSDVKVGERPLKTLCGTYPNVGYADPWVKENIKPGPPKVTCKRCLKIMMMKGLLLEKDFPPSMCKIKKTASKKFFLVSYDSEDMEIFNSLAKLQKEVDEYGPEIVKIQLVDSHRDITVKNVAILIDKNGNEITEEDL